MTTEARITAKLTRKNLVVDAEKLKVLARLLGTSESEAVRTAVDRVLAAREIGDALRESNARGGIDDVIGRMTEETGD